MAKEQSMTYEQAGVDIKEADKFVAMIKGRVAKAWPKMAKEIGGFAGRAKIPRSIRGYRVKDLYSSTDGVGTKLKIAALLGDFSGIGYDAVAMSAVDAYVAGSRPVYLLDYFATGKLIAEKHIAVIDSLIEACQMIDLITFVIGFDDPILLLEPMRAGQKVYGWPSSGPASNGYSLLRKVFGLN